MIKLNNKGFGFAAFIGFLSFLILALIVVAVLSYSTTLSSRNNLNNRNYEYNDNPIDYEKYRKYENDAVEAAKIYVDNNITTLSDKDNLILSINSLPLSVTVTSQCSGYVKVSRLMTSPYYHAYLKCGLVYTSSGYDSSLD